MHEYAADPGRSVDRRRFAAGSAALPRRMHYFSFEISNAPDGCEDVRRCRTGLNPHFLFVLPKRLPGFPAELYRFGTEKPGGYSLLKRECPPRPPKEKRGGISISPRTPLKRHKGRGPWPPPLETNPQGDGGRGQGPSPLETPPGVGRGERQRKEKQRVSSLQPDKCLSPRCGDALRPSANFQRSRQEAFILAAVRTGRSFVWVS